MGSFRPIKVTVGSGGASFTVVGRLIRNPGSISSSIPDTTQEGVVLQPGGGALHASFLIHCLAVVGIGLCECSLGQGG